LNPYQLHTVVVFKWQQTTQPGRKYLGYWLEGLKIQFKVTTNPAKIIVLRNCYDHNITHKLKFQVNEMFVGTSLFVMFSHWNDKVYITEFHDTDI
jgi:hypothetical protein